MNPHRLEAGQVIDGFRLIELMPFGGMASFWRVANDTNDLPMVMTCCCCDQVKIPSPSSATRSSK